MLVSLSKGAFSLRFLWRLLTLTAEPLGQAYSTGKIFLADS